MARSRSTFVLALGLIACRPAAEPGAMEDVGDPAPPRAEVIETLTPDGPLQGDARGGRAPATALTVLEVGPLDHANVYSDLIVRFDAPLDLEASHLEFTFDPPLSGEVRNATPSQYSFAPEQALPGATHFDVHAKGTVKAKDGRTLDVDEQWSFETPRPTVRIYADEGSTVFEEPEIEGGTIRAADWHAKFELEVSHHTTEAMLRKALRVVAVDEAGRETPQPYVLEDRDGGESYGAWHWNLTAKRRWPAGQTIKVSVSEDLTTTAGPLPTGREVFSTVRTRDGVRAKIECYSHTNDGCTPGGATLNFDAALPKRMAKRISISPRPRNLEVYPYVWNGSDTFEEIGFDGDFEPGTTYTIRVGAVRDGLGQPYVGPRKHEISFVAPPPMLELSDSGTLVSSGRGTFGVESRNVEGATLSITTLDDAALAQLVSAPHAAQHRPRKGATSRSKKLDLKPGGTYGWDARSFSLADELGTPRGAAYLELSPGDIVPSERGRASVTDTHALLQLTDLGVAVGMSPSDSFVRVTSLETSEPVANANVRLYDTSHKPPKALSVEATTNDQGIASIGPRRAPWLNTAVVVNAGDDRFAFALDQRGRRPGHSWRSDPPGGVHKKGVMLPDRNLVQPGERVRVMGWVARSDVSHETGLSPAGIVPVELELKDHRDTVLDRAKVKTKAYGKFWATFDVPDDAALGSASVVASLGDQTLHTNFSIKQFVAPAFDVKLALDDADLVGTTKTKGHAIARYLHGMALPVASTSLRRECYAQDFTPPGADAYRVATDGLAGIRVSSPGSIPSAASHEQGIVDFDVDFRHLRSGRSFRCSAKLTITDAARQQITTSAQTWVHPSRYLVGTHEGTARVGEAFELGAEALSYDGTRLGEGKARYRVERIETGDGGRERQVPEHTCTLTMRADSPSTCKWTPSKPGRYDVTLEGEVDGERVFRTQTRYVSKPHRVAKKEHTFEVVVPNELFLGKAFDIEIESPQPKATGSLVQVHAGIRALHAFTTRDHRASISLDPREAWVPAVYFDTLLTQTARKGGLPSISYEHNQASLGLKSRRLEVRIDNAAVASARDRLPIEVHVRDHDGHAVNKARVSVWAVDEGVLMLEPWNFPDFVDVLTPERGNEARYFDGFSTLRYPYALRDDPFEPGVLGGIAGGVGGGSLGGYGAGGGSGALGARRRPPQIRGNFDPAPIFIGDAATGSDGVARVEGTLPDNLTTFRIAAIATAEVSDSGAFARAGRAESRVRVTQELAVRPVMPRVVRPGDESQVGVLIDNLSGAKGELTVELELVDAKGIASIIGGRKSVRRLDGSQLRIPFDIEAQRVGAIGVRVLATLVREDGVRLRDASELKLEIREERTLEHRAATYGTLDEDTAAAIALDLSMESVQGPAAANVEVYTSLLGGYRDAVDTVVHYPYGCLEQTSSRLVPLLALGQLEHYDLGVGSVDAMIEAGIDRIYSMQTPGGGLAYWPEGRTPQLYSTAYATWVLAQLQDAGYPVPPRLVNRAAAYLATTLEAHGTKRTPTAREDVRAAMAMHALAVNGDFDPRPWKRVFDRADTLPVFGRALLALALHAGAPEDPRIETLLASLRKQIDVRGSFARSKAQAVRYTEFFDSPVRTDAIVLLTFATIVPDDPLVEQLARGLAKARDGKEIRNTQESAYALLAMAKYANARESVEPDLDVRAWIDESMVLDTNFEGRDLRTERTQGSFAPHGDARVTLERKGEGLLYYRVGMRWQPDAASIEATASGLMITRSVRDDQGPVEGRAMKAGDIGALDVEITAEMRQRYVVLDVPVPGGFEVVDQSLKRTGYVGPVGGKPKTYAPWLRYSHHEIRDDRVLIFVDELPAGTYRYSVPVRVQHVGTYAFPPARVEAMYQPEIYGHTDGMTLRIE